MAFRFVALLALAASVSAGLIPSGQIAYSAPVVKTAPVANSAPAAYAYPQQVVYQQPAAYQAVKAQRVEEYDPHPQYKFGYDVQDSLSGDSKSQSESRDGDVVQGQYSLIDADGYKRTVQYTADSVHGFNAVVSREPLGVPVKAVAAPAVVARTSYVTAPVVSGYKGYASYADGPVVKGAYAATPVVKATPVAYPISEEH